MTELQERQITKSVPRKGRPGWTMPRRPGTHLKLGISLQDWSHLRRVCQIAKDRCVNPNNAMYPRYGGRGITFGFSTGSDMAEWIVLNIGLRPSSVHTLDRHDNNGGYVAGNLRWATQDEQAKNKGKYVAWKHGDRLRELCRLRPDLSYETIRTWINRGMNNVEILTRTKTTSGRPRIRHP